MSVVHSISQYEDRSRGPGDRGLELPDGQLQPVSRNPPLGGHLESKEGGDGTMISDGDLMARVQAGDRDAFEVIMQRYWSRTLQYALTLTRDSDAAHDTTQEAFLRLWDRRANWVQCGSVRIWLLRTVRNHTISEQRKWKVRSLWAARASSEEARSPRTPLQDAETRELRRAINAAVDRLSPRRREAFSLFHLQGLTYREVAEIMEIREQTVANYLQAALADLRTDLGDFFPALGNRSPSADRDHDAFVRDETALSRRRRQEPAA